MPAWPRCNSPNLLLELSGHPFYSRSGAGVRRVRDDGRTNADGRPGRAAHRQRSVCHARHFAAGVERLAGNPASAISKLEIFGYFALAAFAAAFVSLALNYRPSKPYLYILLGLTPVFVWLPARWSRLDANKPAHALFGGFIVTSLNLLAGVAGPLLDIFFVRTDLTRKQIVATKAATQVFSHIMKIVVYGAPLFALHTTGLPPLWVMAVCVGLSFVGAILGGKILERMTDVNFKRYTRWIVTVLALITSRRGSRFSIRPDRRCGYRARPCR
jgi:uncharacterized membrane protein YfcA